MTKEDKWQLILRLAYRVCTSLFFVSLGLAFMLVPALAKQGDYIHAAFKGLDIGMGIPMFIVLVGLAIMIGILDFCLDYAIGFKKTFQKVKKAN